MSRVSFNEKDLLHEANLMLSKMLAKNPRFGVSNTDPMVKSCNIVLNGNFTTVVLQTDLGNSVGVSKFNPKDIKIMKSKSRAGVEKVWHKSKYSSRAGALRATHRALKTLLGNVG